MDFVSGIGTFAIIFFSLVGFALTVYALVLGGMQLHKRHQLGAKCIELAEGELMDDSVAMRPREAR